MLQILHTLRYKQRPHKELCPSLKKAKRFMRNNQASLIGVGIVLGMTLIASDAFALNAAQANQELTKAVGNVESFLMGPISKLVIYSVFTLSFMASLVKQSVPGAVFAVGGALAYHQVTGWVTNTFTLLV